MTHLLAVLDARRACRHALHGSGQEGRIRPGQPLLTMHACTHAYAVPGVKLKIGTGAAPATPFIWTSKAAQAHPLAGRIQLDFMLAHGLPIRRPLPAGCAGAAVAGRAPAVACCQLALVRQHIIFVRNGGCGAASRGVEAWSVPAAGQQAGVVRGKPAPSIRAMPGQQWHGCDSSHRLHTACRPAALPAPASQNHRAARHACSSTHSPHDKLHRAASRVAAAQAGGVRPHDCTAAPARGGGRLAQMCRAAAGGRQHAVHSCCAVLVHQLAAVQENQLHAHSLFTKCPIGTSGSRLVPGLS